MRNILRPMVGWIYNEHEIGSKGLWNYLNGKKFDAEVIDQLKNELWEHGYLDSKPRGRSSGNGTEALDKLLAASNPA